MGKQSESTAINNLINIVATQGASVKDPGNDLFSSPPKGPKGAKGSQPDLFGTSMRPTARGTQHNIAAAPPAPPVRASRPLPPPVRRTMETPAVLPPPMVAAPPTPAIAQLTGPHAHVDLTGQSFFTENRVENTSRMRAPRAATNKDLIKRLALPAFAVIVLGGSIGGYVAMSGKDVPAPITTAPVKVKATTESAPVTAAAIAPAITTAPPAPETQPAPSHPALVDVRIDSTPSKATVTLIDRGNSMYLGTTPISAAVDPSRTYEIVFSFADRPTKIEKLDPKTTTRLSVILDNNAKPAAKAAVVAAKVEVVSTPKTVARPEKKVAKVEKVAEPDFDLPAAAPKAEKPAAKASVGEGVLMISSKPPCEIVIDGKPTGMMTPQRSMKLPVGKHKITLINQEKDLQMTVPVEINADKPTKVIQNLLGD